DPVIAEGVGLLPALVAEVLAEPHQACWLIATPEFRQRHYPQRGLTDLLGGYSDPQRTYEVWMTRDDEIATHLESQAAGLTLPVQIVDGSRTETETMGMLARQFRLEG